MFKTKELSFNNFIFYDDMVINRGEINFITGASGSGKSTLLKLFNRTENYSGGEIFYKDKPITEYDSILLRKEVKLISQTTFLFSGTIEENFNLFHEYCEHEKITQERMNYFLKLTKAKFSLDTGCDTLSGGERQRVYIAICLSMNSEVIMLDEPTSALDYKLAVQVLENISYYIKEQSKTLIVVSHDAKLVQQFAQNRIVLSEGGRND